MFPSVLKWQLLLQAPASGVAIYASVLIFSAQAVAFVLGVVATVLHFLLGIYSCLALSRPGYRYVYVVPCCLAIICAGLWCGPLYYFARSVAWPRVGWLGSTSLEKDTDWPRLSRWAKGGCAMSVMSILLDLVLLGLLLPSGRRRENQNSDKGSFTSSTLDTPPQLPPLSPIQHHRISLPYAAPETPGPDRNQHIPPTIFIVKPADEPRVKATEKQLPPLPLPLPPSPPPSSPRIPSDTIIEPATGRLNRVALILALTRLQDPRTGTWAPTAELTGLLQAWAGGRRAISINLNIGGHGATALAHACLIDLCQTVWTAQRKGTEAAVLSAEELRSLERVGWNLGWVAERIRQAGAWLERRNR